MAQTLPTLPDPDCEMGPTWVLVRPLPRDVPSAIRVRAWLKRGLRDFGLKVEQVSGVGPEQSGPSAAVKGEGEQ